MNILELHVLPNWDFQFVTINILHLVNDVFKTESKSTDI